MARCLSVVYTLIIISQGLLVPAACSCSRNLRGAYPVPFSVTKFDEVQA